MIGLVIEEEVFEITFDWGKWTMREFMLRGFLPEVYAVMLCSV